MKIEVRSQKMVCFAAKFNGSFLSLLALHNYEVDRNFIRQRCKAHWNLLYDFSKTIKKIGKVIDSQDSC